MRTPWAAAVVCLLAAGLIGCQKTPDASRPAVPDAAAPGTAKTFPGTQSESPTTTSVAPGEVGVAPATAKASEPAASGRTNNSMTRAQESNAMPLPGQNNDHSAPLPKPASSAPRTGTP
jgi:hypothetical protein